MTELSDFQTSGPGLFGVVTVLATDTKARAAGLPTWSHVVAKITPDNPTRGAACLAWAQGHLAEIEEWAHRDYRGEPSEMTLPIDS
jgi:hypothetical protein